MMSSDDCLRAAWAAILRGDLAERDRLCKLAENIMRAGDRVRSGKQPIVGDDIKIKSEAVICLPDRSKELLQ